MKKNASVLLFVLGMIVILGFVMTQIFQYAQIELKSRATVSADYVLRSDAYDALYAVIAELEEYREIDGGLYSKLQGWGECFSSGRVVLPSETTVSVNVEDVTGKLSLPNMRNDDLIKLFEYIDIPSQDAIKLAECFKDWTDTGDEPSLNGAEKDDYAIGAPTPPNRFIKSFNELLFIKNFPEYFADENGNPNDLYRRFTGLVSLDTFRDININSVNEDVLGFILYKDDKEFDQKAFNAIRGIGVPLTDNITWVKNLTELNNRGVFLPVQNMVCESSRVKIEILIIRGMAEYKLTAIYGSASKANAASSRQSTRSQRGADEGTDVGASTIFGRVVQIYEKTNANK